MAALGSSPSLQGPQSSVNAWTSTRNFSQVGLELNSLPVVREIWEPACPGSWEEPGHVSAGEPGIISFCSVGPLRPSPGFPLTWPLHKELESALVDHRLPIHHADSPVPPQLPCLRIQTHQGRTGPAARRRELGLGFAGDFSVLWASVM